MYHRIELPKPPPGWLATNFFSIISTPVGPHDDLYWYDEDMWWAHDSDERATGVKPKWILDIGTYWGRPVYICKVIKFRPLIDLCEGEREVQEMLAWHPKLKGPEDTHPDWESPYAVDELECPDCVMAWIARWYGSLS